MLFYVLFALCVSFLLGLGHLYPHKNNLLQWVVFVLMVCVLGLREYVGVDFAYYVNWYVNGTRDDKMEFGYVFIMNIFRFLNLNYHFLFFFFSFFTCLFLFLGIKKYTVNQNFAFIIFLLLPVLYLVSFSSIRQSFSVSMCFYAFYYLIHKKYVIYVLLMLAGIAIHNTAIIPFLVFPLVLKFADRVNLPIIVVLLFVSFLISKLHFIQNFYFLFENTRYSYYFSPARVPVNMYKLIVLNLVALFGLFHFEKMIDAYPNQKYIMLLYFFSVLFINLFSTLDEMTRIAYYFRIFEIIVISDLIFLYAKRKKTLLLMAFYLYYFSAYLYTLNGDLKIENSSKLIPYKTFVL